MIRLEEIPIHALGEMDGSTVAWIVDQTLRNPQAQRQFGKAAWALTQDTNLWRDKCRAEYLKSWRGA